MTAEQKVEELIDIIRAEKENRKLNYKELSKETGVSNQSLIHWLNYHFYPDCCRSCKPWTDLDTKSWR